MNYLSMSTRLCLTAAVVMALSPTLVSAAMITVESESVDYQNRSDGNLSTTANPSQIGSLASGLGANTVFIFELPALPGGEVVTNANLRLKLDGPTGSPAFNADLYGIGFFSATTAQNVYYDSAVTDPSATLIYDSFLTPATGVGTPAQQSYMNAAGQEALGAYLQTFYDANPGYAGTGQYVFLRLNPDATSTGSATTNVYRPRMGESLDSNFRPLLDVDSEVIPEPASLALLGVGGLLMLRRRR